MDPNCELNWGEGNIDEDPLFVDPDGCDDVLGTTDDNLRLSVDSPCIDAGDSNTVPGPNDIEGGPRVIGPGGIDMGAYEYHTEIAYSPDAFNFSGLKDFPDQIDYLDVWNSSEGELRYSISYDCNWLNVDPGSGALNNDELCGGVPDFVEHTLRVDLAGLDANDHDCDVTISAPYATNSPQVVHVDLNVQHNCFSGLMADDPAHTYSQRYADFIAYVHAYNWDDDSEMNCWCGVHSNPPWPNQCYGDACNDTHSRGYIVFTCDLDELASSWKAKLGDAHLNPCADFDHKEHSRGYRVFTGDLEILLDNWKATVLPGDCPRPE